MNDVQLLAQGIVTGDVAMIALALETVRPRIFETLDKTYVVEGGSLRAWDLLTVALSPHNQG